MWKILLGLVTYSQKNAAMLNNPAFKFHFYGIFPSKIPQIRIYLYSNTNYTSTLFFRRSLGRIRQFSQIRALSHDASPTWLLWVLPHVSHASKYRQLNRGNSWGKTHEFREFLRLFSVFAFVWPNLYFKWWVFWLLIFWHQVYSKWISLSWENRKKVLVRHASWGTSIDAAIEI